METKEAAQAETEKLIREWFYVGQEVTRESTGEKLTVVGFAEKYLGRGGRDHKRAGVYIDYTLVRTVDKYGHEQNCGAVYISTTAGFRNETLGKMAGLLVRIGDLPDTKFWVGDIVAMPNPTQAPQVIERVDYNQKGFVGGFSYFHGCQRSGEENLTLVERGNVWKLEHGEPLSFPGETEGARLLEEAAFYKSLEMSHKVARMVVDETEVDYLWQFWSAVQRLQEGSGDRIIVKDKKTQHVVLIKYDNEEFGARMRKAELERIGF